MTTLDISNRCYLRIGDFKRFNINNIFALKKLSTSHHQCICMCVRGTGERVFVHNTPEYNQLDSQFFTSTPNGFLHLDGGEHPIVINTTNINEIGNYRDCDGCEVVECECDTQNYIWVEYDENYQLRFNSDTDYEKIIKYFNL